MSQRLAFGDYTCPRHCPGNFLLDGASALFQVGLEGDQRPCTLRCRRFRSGEQGIGALATLAANIFPFVVKPVTDVLL